MTSAKLQQAYEREQHLCATQTATTRYVRREVLVKIDFHSLYIILIVVVVVVKHTASTPSQRHAWMSHVRAGSTVGNPLTISEF